MNGADDVFEAERDRLFGLAYRMLGSVADADDVLQDAWLRWRDADHDGIDNPAAFLTTVVSRLSLDRLTSAQRRREHYVGSWLPEPLATAATDDPESAALMEESVMLGFLTVLERLGPVERAVFVLREVFDLPYEQLAVVVDRNEENCRQIAKRARDRVRAERPRIAPDPDRDRRLLDAFVAAVSSGRPAELEQLLRDDVVLVSDGGEKVRAARHPIVGVDRVVRFLFGIARRARAGDVVIDHVAANGQIGLTISVGDDRSFFVLEPDASGDGIMRIFVHRNPAKLARLVHPHH